MERTKEIDLSRRDWILVGVRYCNNLSNPSLTECGSLEIGFSGVGCLPECKIDCRGLIILTGFNDSGKSTILKALYSVMCCPEDLRAIKDSEIRATIGILGDRLGLSGFPKDDDMDSVIEGLDKTLSSDDGIDRSLLEHVMELHRGGSDVDSRFYERIVGRKIMSEFDSIGYFRTVSGSRDAVISISGGPDFECRVSGDDGISCKGDLDRMPRAVFWDSPFIMDAGSPQRDRDRFDHREYMLQMLNSPGAETLILDEMYRDNLRILDDHMRSVIPGEFINTPKGVRYRMSDGNAISLCDVASGLKIFGMLRMLIGKGCLHQGDVLLLDEPEAYLHPSWINPLADVIVALVKDLGIRVVMTSHSQHLLMAVEAKTTQMKDMVNNYNLSRSEDRSIIVEDVTGNLEKMYLEMADPVEDVVSAFW